MGILYGLKDGCAGTWAKAVNGASRRRAGSKRLGALIWCWTLAC